MNVATTKSCHTSEVAMFTGQLGFTQASCVMTSAENVVKHCISSWCNCTDICIQATCFTGLDRYICFNEQSFEYTNEIMGKSHINDRIIITEYC